MDDDSTITMDSSECEAFLESITTGVISLSTEDGNPPHSIPVSFGYDPVESVLYFRLARDSQSEKGPLDGRHVSFVAYALDEDTGKWESAIATGVLERTTNEDIALETLDGLERVNIPLFDMFGVPTSDVEFAFFRLVPDSLTGRTEELTGYQ